MAKKQLWRVPLIYLIGGIATHFLIIRVLGRFAIVTLPDGTITADLTRQTILYGILFFAVLLIGGLRFLRGMTYKEIFLSSTIVVIYGSILLIIQGGFGVTSGTGAVALLWLHIPLEWCDFIQSLVYQLFGGMKGIWMGAVAQVFVPYLFVLFGSRNHESAKLPS